MFYGSRSRRGRAAEPGASVAQPWVWSVVAVCLALPAAGQHSAQHHGGSHLERLPSATLPPPPLMDGIGDASMPITTDSRLAAKYFDQGLRLTHCFWDFEAYRAFKEATRQDPEAVMPYWGLFMSLNYNPKELRDERMAALARAKALAAGASVRERRYVGAIAQLHSAGQSAYIRAMEALIEAHPEDLQARLILVKYLVTDAGGVYPEPGGGNGDAYARAREMLRPLLESHPESAAVHHYWIHAHEASPDPEAALESAEKLPRLAPKSGHMLHMPGHIYYRIGAYDKAYEAFRESLRFDRDYMQANGIGPVDNWNYTHNLDYLVAGCAEDGRYREGQRYAEILSDLPVARERSQAVGLGYVVYGGLTAPARLHLRYGRWRAAAESLEEVLGAGSARGSSRGRAGRVLPSRNAADYLAGLLAYARGMDAVERRDVARSGSSFQELLGVSMKLTRQQAELGSDWYFDAARRILSIGALELGGSLMSLQGQQAQAVVQLERAIQMERVLGYGEPPHYSRPVAESLAAVHLRAGDHERALRAYEQVLAERPNSGHAWFGIARCHQLAGRAADARAAYRRFLEAWRHADRDLPQVELAEAWLAENP